MTTAYLVSDGECDDYKVRGVYSTKENAEEACKLFGDGSRIEELQQDAMPDHSPGMYRFEVSISTDKKPILCTLVDVTRAPKETTWRPEYNTPWNTRVGIVVYIWAKDEADAIDAAKQFKTGLITSGEYTTNYEV